MTRLRELLHIIKTHYHNTTPHHNLKEYYQNTSSIPNQLSTCSSSSFKKTKALYNLNLKMQFTTIALVLACATGLLASPLRERNSTEILTFNEYVELYREPSSNGVDSLVYYGLASGTKTLRSEANPVEERASCAATTAPTCSTSRSARNDICDQLVTELFNDSEITVDQSPRQICYEGAAAESNEYCCVSWHNVVPSLIKGDLANYANTILQKCTSNGISGKIYNVLVHQTCTSVCLSNRGTGC
jgi:hypothetical protein